MHEWVAGWLDELIQVLMDELINAWNKEYMC